MKKNGTKKAPTRDPEERHNRVAVAVLALIGALFAVLGLGDRLGFLYLACEPAAFLLTGCGVGMLVFPLVARAIGWKNPALKHVILSLTFVPAGIVYFFYPLDADPLITMPILISTLYFQPGIIRRTARINWVVFACLIWGNVLTEQTSAVMQNLHAIQEVRIWQMPMEVLYYHFVPRTIMLIAETQICLGVARTGRELVAAQGRTAALEAELSAAAGLQVSALPDTAAELDGIRIRAFMRPETSVGGDFYDYFRVGGDLVFLIADVSGNGMPAALFMMKAKNALRTAVAGGESLAVAVPEVNRLLCRDNKKGMFVTLWIARVNPHTGRGTYLNCGHLPPLVRHADGTVTHIENEPELVLGVFDEAELTAHELALSSGDTILLFTDGMTDAVSAAGEPFGDGRLARAAAAMPADSPDPCAFLVGTVDLFAAGADQFDDMTCLSLRFPRLTSPVEGTLRASADREGVTALLDGINDLLATVACPTDARREIDTALDEVCANVADYAYPDSQGEILLSYSAGTNFLSLEVIDSGVPFDPTTVPAPDTEGEPRIGGLGVYLARSLMTTLSYTRSEDQNHLRLLKIWHT